MDWLILLKCIPKTKEPVKLFYERALKKGVSHTTVYNYRYKLEKLGLIEIIDEGRHKFIIPTKFYFESEKVLLKLYERGY